MSIALPFVRLPARSWDFIRVRTVEPMANTFRPHLHETDQGRLIIPAQNADS
ncbi:MAG TPA: hypothetical protein VH599_01925 [Ktedonobacterales bacterium]